MDSMMAITATPSSSTYRRNREYFLPIMCSQYCQASPGAIRRAPGGQQAPLFCFCGGMSPIASVASAAKGGVVFQGGLFYGKSNRLINAIWLNYHKYSNQSSLRFSTNSSGSPGPVVFMTPSTMAPSATAMASPDTVPLIRAVFVISTLPAATMSPST